MTKVDREVEDVVDMYEVNRNGNQEILYSILMGRMMRTRMGLSVGRKKKRLGAKTSCIL